MNRMSFSPNRMVAPTGADTLATPIDRLAARTALGRAVHYLGVKIKGVDDDARVNTYQEAVGLTTDRERAEHNQRLASAMDFVEDGVWSRDG